MSNPERPRIKVACRILLEWETIRRYQRFPAVLLIPSDSVVGRLLGTPGDSPKKEAVNIRTVEAHPASGAIPLSDEKGRPGTKAAAQ